MTALSIAAFILGTVVVFGFFGAVLSICPRGPAAETGGVNMTRAAPAAPTIRMVQCAPGIEE
jgi:hypothetical protein